MSYRTKGEAKADILADELRKEERKPFGRSE